MLSDTVFFDKFRETEKGSMMSVGVNVLICIDDVKPLRMIDSKSAV